MRPCFSVKRAKKQSNNGTGDTHLTGQIHGNERLHAAAQAKGRARKSTGTPFAASLAALKVAPYRSSLRPLVCAAHPSHPLFFLPGKVKAKKERGVCQWVVVRSLLGCGGGAGWLCVPVVAVWWWFRVPRCFFVGGGGLGCAGGSFSAAVFGALRWFVRGCWACCLAVGASWPFFLVISASHCCLKALPSQTKKLAGRVINPDVVSDFSPI